ncbi:DUF3048 domain-containing protein [Sporosarcina sp. Marseille-Q4063]|uniref:DUF3048 domain-containing protein n=1 Tax=Sporosarcina sp. Marseille-Q4063 TaxID=2810514 RepID=UPI001BB041A9|nr:DUF3048 domain-containing protein [Sporosarcina sp. Marseille-Q4063]QUW23639.1 DUF3048 domain-containing protein [Sporosarcina sp. Marseille-Q4063]
MKSKQRLLIYILLAILLVSACSKDQAQEPDTEPTDPTTKEPTEEPVEEPVLYKAPFTGVMSEEESLRRPVAVMINNHPLARPQSGLSDADIVYELITEGNVTRLLALFQSELPEQIGPVRSARDYFIHIAKGLDAFYVAHGYSPDALDLLNSGYVDHVNGMRYDGTLFKRSSDRKAPHNSYISNDSIKTAEETTNSSMEINKMPSLSFHESIESAKIGDNATSIVVQNGKHPDYTSTYSYNEENGTYDRTVNGIVTIDKTNDEPLALSNVLVFEAEHQTIDNEGRQTIDLELGGKALLFQAGIVKEIEWVNLDGILTPFENGDPANLVPGKTWIHVIKTNPGIGTNVSYNLGQ